MNLSLRSRRKHNAWGVSPREAQPEICVAREAGDRRYIQCRNRCRFRCRPLRGLTPPYLIESWGLRPRLYAAVRSADCMIRFLTSSGWQIHLEIIRQQLKQVPGCALTLADVVTSIRILHHRELWSTFRPDNLDCQAQIINGRNAKWTVPELSVKSPALGASHICPTTKFFS